MARYPHRISSDGFIALTWAGFGVATTFVICRAWIRLRILDRFGWPDLWISLSFCTLLASAIVQTCATPLLYARVRHEADPTVAPPDESRERHDFAAYFMVLTFLFLSTLWTVKAAFLALFNPLFEGMQITRRCWMGVTIFTGLLYISCLVTPIVVSAMPRKGSPEHPKISADLETALILYAAVADIVSDLMITILPLPLIWHVHLSRSQKWGLSAVFGVSGITVLTAIVRATQVGDARHSDLVWLFVWGVIESSVAVIVGCLPSFKVLIQPPHARSRRTYYVFTSNVRASSVPYRDPSSHPLEHSRSGLIPTFAPDSKSGMVTQIYRSESREDILSPRTRETLEKGGEIRVQTQFDFAFNERA